MSDAPTPDTAHLARVSQQDAAGAALIDYLAHRDDTRLSDAQLAEVRRRRADPDRKLASHTQGKGRLGR